MHVYACKSCSLEYSCRCFIRALEDRHYPVIAPSYTMISKAFTRRKRRRRRRGGRRRRRKGGEGRGGSKKKEEEEEEKKKKKKKKQTNRSSLHMAAQHLWLASSVVPLSSTILLYLALLQDIISLVNSTRHLMTWTTYMSWVISAVFNNVLVLLQLAQVSFIRCTTSGLYSVKSSI